MSGHQITAEFSQYVIAASFLPPSLEPVLYAVFLLDFREGYMAILRAIPARILGIFKGLVFAMLSGQGTSSRCV